MKKIIFLWMLPLFFLNAETNQPEQNTTEGLEEKARGSDSAWSRSDAIQARDKRDDAREKMEKDVEKMIQDTMNKRDKGE